MKNFFSNFQSSFYSPKFYSDIPKKPFKQAFGYFLLLTFFLTIIQLISFVSPLLVEAPLQIQLFAQNTRDCFPKDLEVTIKNGQLSTNAQEPYFLPSCSGSNSESLAVIDTKTPFSAAKFDEYQQGSPSAESSSSGKASIWVTKDSVFYKSNNLEMRSYSLTKIQDFKINKNSIDQLYDSISPWFKFVGPVLLILSALGLYLAYDFRLIYLVFLAGVIFLLSKFFKQKLTYGESYKIGLFAITLGFIVDLLTSLTRYWTNFSGFPFMFTIITIGVVLANYFLPKNSE